MARLSEKEKKEFIALARSFDLCIDMERVSETRHNPFLRNGVVDADKFIMFLTEYNHFINHDRPDFCKIIDKDMRL